MSRSMFSLPASSIGPNSWRQQPQSSSLSPVHQMPGGHKKSTKLPKVAPKPIITTKAGQHLATFNSPPTHENGVSPISPPPPRLYSTPPQNSNLQYNNPVIQAEQKIHQNELNFPPFLQQQNPIPTSADLSQHASPINNTTSQQLQHKTSPAKLTPCHVLYNSQEESIGGGKVRKTSPECVYLRPEQNIPDSFSTKFKPISPASNTSSHQSSSGKKNLYLKQD